ncbi:Uma2 family endonuclease [Streptomyces sp. NPDC004647]|uniref:Uma2 family endonuclease n=1 Tax=Streptomyces sp. NPDC004647 TaxID=3154671 RepID=UPI0033AA896B
MTAPLPDHELEDLLRTYEHLEVPEGQRAELIGGEIVISPTPANFHNWIYSELHYLLGQRARPRGWSVTNTTTVVLPATGEHFIPDLIVCESAALRDTEDWRITAEDVLLAAEITSPSTARRDRTAKVWGYAHSLLPVYLLVDPQDGEGSTTVYANPDGKGSYRDQHRVLFGEKLLLPEPFGLELDTSVFLKT